MLPSILASSCGVTQMLCFTGYAFLVLVLMSMLYFVFHFPEESKLIAYGITNCPYLNCNNRTTENITIYLDNYDIVNVPYNIYDDYERDSPFCQLPNGAKCIMNHDNVLSDARFFVACKRRNEFLSKVMPRYCKEQIIVQFNHEPEMYKCNTVDKSEHDVTVNYKLSSDVPLPYICGNIDKLIEVAKKPPPTTKTKGIALFLTKCHKNKDRLNFIQELMKYIHVDSYGECFHNTDLPVTRKVKDWQGVIPIYRGTPDIFDQVPGSNTFLFVDNFTSPKALADYVRRIESDKQLYESFFKMDLSKYYEIKKKYCNFSRVCSICNGAYKKKLAIQRNRCGI